ncbi:extracellular solute-binding protein [Paroceanicella profunda]|uniref:Extracellular solute-binding protein n=1 Tax=Paroceanicella profunda TaxID=2579971 RepID=A0A5B8G247_9RHOB|nr:extracellular solute-binding protein [Paroceanicella profunda]QDL93359.1 extracellular solute-binding protein [Paroceanicella profunda]
MTKLPVARAARPLLAPCAALALTAGFAQADEIRVLNWQGYGTDEAWALDAFAAKTGHTVVHEYFNSEQEMLTKLRTNPGAYDVVLINTAYTGQAAREGLIQKLDYADFPHASGIPDAMKETAALYEGGALYGIPWVWGVTSIAYNTEVLPEAPQSIELLWSPDFAGRVGWRDDAVESVQMAAISLGQDINNPTNWEAIEAKLKALKPQIRTFWSSENEWNQYFSSGEFDISVYWSGSAARSANNFGLPVGFAIPKEGAIGWLDGLSLAADAPHPEAAKAFIDYMIDPEFYVKWDTDVGAPVSANAEAVAALPDKAFNKVLASDEGVAARLKFLGPIDDDVREHMLQVWQATKTEFQN